MSTRVVATSILFFGKSILSALNPKCLIQVNMLVRFYHEKGTNPVLNSLMWYLAINGSVRREQCFVYSEVTDWAVFCNCFWKALAEVSRESHPDEMRRRYVIYVVDYECRVSVWYDEDGRCLRYCRE